MNDIKYQVSIICHHFSYFMGFLRDIQYVYDASITWNWARQVIKSNTDINDSSFSSADEKAILKNHILLSQKMGNPCEWNKYREIVVLF